MINWHDTKAFERALAAAKISVDDFAPLSGVSRAQLYRLKAGAKPNWETDQKIRDALNELGVSVAETENAPECAVSQPPRIRTPKGIGA